MNELMKQENQTPIEIALGIDEEGMTTARKLYEFLELAKGQFSRWAKTNITENEFATENEDYWGFDINVEGNMAQDFKLTAHFAKKLSMKGNGERAEEAREYFTTLEEKVKQKTIDLAQLSPELQMFQKIFNSVAEQQLEQKRQAEKVEQLDKKVDSIKDVIALNPNSWRSDSVKIINKIALHMGGYEHIKMIREESYKILEERMGVALKVRLSNKKKTQALNGVCKSKIDKLNQLDVIADDKKLIQGYVSVIKDMAIKYGVTEVA
ncbi:MAG: antA/AntB antirepressor family protein [Lachnospiraceae bacterium]|nr:antA/AntB antirepressor family protein [Lachnospiraceae bacterium]